MKTTLPLALMIATFSVSAQKVDLDRFNFKTHFLQLPKEHIPLDYRTYGVKVTVGSRNFGVDESRIYDKIEIGGFKKVEEDPTIGVNLDFDRFLFTDKDVKERVDEKKAKDGTITKTFYYKVTANWRGYGSYEIYAPTKEKPKDVPKKQEKSNVFLKNTSVADGKTDRKSSARPVFKGYFDNPPQYESQEFSSAKAASDFFERNYRQINDDAANEFVQRAVAKVNHIIAENYALVPVEDSDFLWILNSKKHPEYEYQKQAIDAAKVLFQNIEAEGSLEQAIADFKPLIRYFDDLKTKYKTDDKNDKKMRFAAYYNLAKIYYYLDMPEKVITEAEGLIKNDYDKFEGDALNRKARELRDLLRLHNTGTRHFSLR